VIEVLLHLEEIAVQKASFFKDSSDLQGCGDSAGYAGFVSSSTNGWSREIKEKVEMEKTS
jgi:hypothetical protein